MASASQVKQRHHPSKILAEVRLAVHARQLYSAANGIV